MKRFRTSGVAFPLLLMAALAATTLPVMRQTEAKMQAPRRDTYSDTWVATDALGRTLPDAATCGPPKKDRFVGIFYFLWLDQRHDGAGLFDNSKLLAANPTDPQYGPVNAFHWWGEPRLGYYRTSDPFVIRKHAQLLTDAGVDVIILDVTNAITYDDVYENICRVYTEMRQAGQPTPQIAFIANSNSAVTVQHLYETFYAKNRYPALWFRWKGKPLILAPPDGLSEEVKAFFTIRHSWAWSDPKGWFGDGKDRWPWLDNYPQNYGWHESKDRPEEVPVCVAQHPTSNIGRSFHGGKEPPPGEQSPAAGLCFAEQWERALKIDPEFIFITGWNEWAQRFVSGPNGGPGFLGRTLKPGETFFVDEYNQEYSRDIEPMRGGHGDNYYYQMAEGIRRYKGVRPRPKASAPRTIPVNRADFSAWDTVSPTYQDDLGDTTHRDHDGWNGAGRYTNTTGRNDFDTMKVARDASRLYFYVRTRDPITPPDAHSNWMTLLLDTDSEHRTGWEGYEFAVRRVVRGGKEIYALCRNLGNRWEWQPIADVSPIIRGNAMHFALPRAALNLAPDRGPLRFDFKWVDNVPDSGDILDFIDHGDVAPNGRFNYRFEE